jgi:uncharacterized membrane protein
MASSLPISSYKGVYWILGSWGAFIAENVIVSENREYIIREFGEDNYHLLYNTLSTAACSSLLYGYIRHGRHQGPVIGARSILARLSGFSFQSLGFVGLSQLFPEVQVPVAFDMTKTSTSSAGLAAVAPASNPNAQLSPTSSNGMSIRFKCPMDFKGYNDQKKNGIFGIERISRHPVFWSMGFACLGPALRTIYLSEAIMFSFPITMSLIGTTHMDSRYRRGLGGYLAPDMEQATSNIPFLALLKQKQSWNDLYQEMRWSNAAIAVAIALRLALRKV